ncbi:class I SAM-dependent DNA methyltransferase [Pseudomonas syringae]
MSISSTIKSIQDIMRKDVGVDGDAQRIGQLVWLLFLKIFDDRELEWELMDDNYRSPIPDSCRWRTWAADPEGMTGDALKDFIDNNLFPQLQNLHEYSNTPSAFVVRSVFKDAYNYMKSGQLLRQVINKVQEGVDFNKAQERHEFGNLYEQLLRDLQNAGNAGEFYTPRPVTEFMVRMVDPKLDEKVMDPACGTGGFLTCAIDHKRSRYVKTAEDERTLQASIFGVEKKPLPHLLATTNMILHGIEVPSQIKHDNTLSKPLISWGPSERVHCIVAKQAPVITNQKTARTLLAAEVTHRLHAERTFGQRKLQKVVYLAEHAVRLQAIQGSYLRNVAGPHDRHLMNQIEAELEKHQWYERIDRQTVGHAYRPLSQAGQHRQAYNRTWSANEQANIEQVIELMRDWDTDRCEMTVTLYAAWNDFIIEGRPVTDEAIVDEVMHRWNEAKLRFSRGEWLSVLTEMKKHGLLTPTGFGKRTSGGTLTLPGFE